MATTHPFAINTGTTIDGTNQVGNIAMLTGDTLSGDVIWWMGPDEDNGYVVAVPDTGFTHQNSQIPGSSVGIGFRRSVQKTDESYLNLINSINRQFGGTGTYDTLTDARLWLESNGMQNTYQLVSYQAESTALFNRMTEEPSTALKTLIDKTIVDLKTSGIWDKTDKLHKWDLHTEQASLLDWKNSDHDATNYNNCHFTKAWGVRTTIYANYLDMNFRPDTGSTYGTLDDMAMAVDDMSGGRAVNGPNVGAYNTGNTSAFLFRTREGYVAGNTRPWVFINGLTQRVYNSQDYTTDPFFYGVRSNNTTLSLFRLNTDGGTSASTTSSPSAAMIDQSLVFGGKRETTGSVSMSNIDSSFYWIGQGLTAEQRGTLYDILTYWKSQIGSVFPYTYSSEIINNGGFDDTSNWTIVGGWVISGGTANRIAGSGSNRFYNDVVNPISGDSVYEVTFTISNLDPTETSAYLWFSDSGGSNTAFLGAYNTYFPFPTGTTTINAVGYTDIGTFAIWGSDTYNPLSSFSIDNFSIKRITNV